MGYALEHINLERAKIIWNILKEHYKRIHGTVEQSTYQDYRYPWEEEKFSKMGELLIKYQWLPDTGGNFHKPSEILLSELHGEFDKESLDAKCVAEELKFKTVEEDQFLKQLPIAKRKRYELVNELYQIMPEEKMDKILEKMIEQNRVKKDDFTAQDVTTKFKESLVTPESSSTDSTQDGGWNGLTPGEEEQIRKAYGNEFSGRVERTHIIREPKIITGSKIEDIINPQEFLYEQYKGHCQICNTRLDLGPIKRPYFEVFRIRETQGKNPETNMEFNVLCLCPNCHALMKHGGRDLESVWETAEKVSKREVAPEEVGERSGDFYIINIKVARKEREIFYTPTHMATIAAVVEQTTKKEEEPVLTAATAIQEDGNYEPVNDNKNQLQPLIKQAFEMAKHDDGWAYLADMGNYLKKLDSDFNHRSYGYSKLNEMIRVYEDVLGLKIRYSPPKKEK